MIVVAKNLSVLQLFISRMPKMCAILQLVSAPLNAGKMTKRACSFWLFNLKKKKQTKERKNG